MIDSNNPHFDHLEAALNADSNPKVDRNALLMALYVISAHRNLRGIITSLHRFFTVADRDPRVFDINGKNLTQEFALLRRISRLEQADAHFYEAYENDSGLVLPTFPYTGDSVICELMLTTTRLPEHEENYETFLLWFAYLALNYNLQKQNLEKYKKYLLGPELESRESRPAKLASVVYAASHEAKYLGQANQAELLATLAQEWMAPTYKNCFDMAVVVTFSKKKYGKELARLEYGIKKRSFERIHKYVTGCLPSAITRLVKGIWLDEIAPDTGEGNGAPKNRTRRLAPQIEIIRLSNKNQLFSESSIDESGDEMQLTYVTLADQDPYQIAGKSINPAGGRRQILAEPTEITDLAHCKLVLSDKPLWVLHHWGLTILHRQEMKAANLPCAATRLSEEGLSAVQNLLRPHHMDRPNVLLTKLLVAISFLTGRDLKTAAKTFFFDETFAPSSEQPIGINYQSRTLLLQLAYPDLQGAQNYPRFDILKRHANHLEILLPTALQQLCEALDWNPAHLNELPTKVKGAHHLLATLPQGLRVNAGTLKEQLGQTLYRNSKGDIGIEKVLTDNNGINANNVIHYASYSVNEATTALLAAHETLLGEAQTHPLAPDDRHVGCFDALCQERLRDIFSTLKSAIQQCHVEDNPIKFFNLITSYTVCWLNLAVAGRATVSPTPITIVSSMAVVDDKHRADGSALRLVPITPTLQLHLRSYIEFTRWLATRVPELQPLKAPKQTLARLCLILDGKITDYRPIHLANLLIQEGIPPLPGNWGRKFFCQAATRMGLEGRVISAVMGHFVAGRHPLSNISNLAMPYYKARVISCQAQLEQTLGFDTLESLCPFQAVQPSWHLLWVKRHTGFKPKEIKPEYPFDIDKLLSNDKRHYLAELEHETDKNRKAKIIDDMVRHSVRRVSTRYGPEAVLSWISTLCSYLQNEHKVSIGELRKHRAFTREWVSQLADLQNLAYFEEHLLPKFYRDLEHLPKPDSERMSSSVDLGRLVMICIWRLGLTSWPLIWAFLKQIVEKTIAATGNAHYVEIQVKAQRNKALCKRTVIIDDYSLVYLLTRHNALSKTIKPLLNRKSHQARSTCERGLKAYVRPFLPEIPASLLSCIAGSAKQYLLVNSSPIISAYSSQEFETHDVEDRCLRRLAGLAPRQTAITSAEVKLTEATLGKQPLPLEQLLDDPSLAFYKNIVKQSSPYISERLRRLRTTRAKNRAENLFLSFCNWFYQQEEANRVQKYNAKQKRAVRRQLALTAYCLVAAIDHNEDNSVCIDNDWFAALQESFVDNDFNLAVAPTLNLIRAYCDSTQFESLSKRENIALGELDNDETASPRNEILSLAEIDRVRQVLESPLAPITNWDTREAACNFFCLISTYGLRRNEAVGLRGKDYQGDLIRVQPYENHRLKTRAADRWVVIAMLDLAARKVFERNKTHKQLINKKPDEIINGHSFYDPINKLIQCETKDKALHLHTLRHTVASNFHLLANTASAPIELMVDEFPWLAPLTAKQQDFDLLIGTEGPTGHGEQATSAFLGHAHPSTTHRHYIHTHCFSLFAALRRLDQINPLRAFEYHLQSPRTMQALIQKWKLTTDPNWKNLLLKTLVAKAKKAHPKLIDVDETLLKADAEPVDYEPKSARDPHSVSFDSLLALDSEIYGAIKAHQPVWANPTLQKLEALHSIKSGKKGCSLSRIEMNERFYTPIHQQLEGPSAREAAPHIANHLETLRVDQPDEFKWLLDKFINRSERARCRVMLTGRDEKKRWASLSTSRVKFTLIENATTRAIKTKGRTKSYYGQISCPAEDGSVTGKDTTAIRWAMTLAIVKTRPSPLN